jgi:ATP-dependent DNA ligase
MPRLEEAITDLRFANQGVTVLDGECVFLTPEGKADFARTASIMGSGTAVAIRKQFELGLYVKFVAFDCMYYHGVDVREMPIERRKARLWQCLCDLRCPDIVGLEHVVTGSSSQAELSHQEYTTRYGEGSVYKRFGSSYPNGRSYDWLKRKAVYTEDVIVMGATEGNGKFAGLIGALVFGQYIDGKLTQIGQCSGMTDEARAVITLTLPVLVAKRQVFEIVHNGVMSQLGYRHPNFVRFRDDKRPEECIHYKERNGG